MGHGAITPNPWMILPFVLLLGAIALGPVGAPGWWARHYAKVAIGLGAVTLGYYLFGLHAYARLGQVGHEYVSFIVLIGSLFVVAGGIHLKVKGVATPGANALFLFIGAVVANVLGTTGASMLLIRPWIRMNQGRIAAHHIVFFIFIVANVGGCLTPIGDPPLFLGYLQGVPFWWVAQRCWAIWAVGVGFLLAVFYAIDANNYRRASQAVRAEPAEARDQWRCDGLGNIGWLLVILGAVFLRRPLFVREALMAAAALGSWFSTRKGIHEANQFNLHPIREVAILFIGIFATMPPALDWLQTHAGSFASSSPAFFYWGAGGLSSVLDNAPTYLAFLSVATGLFAAFGLTGPPAEIASLLGQAGFSQSLLAISIGSVFFGANTYIGNGPNFMVKAIADQQRVRTPGFLGFICCYTLPCMGPLLVLVWLIFFRGG